ncbi:hypothetical protein AKJ09_04980 [Labilithrix luteola]|uniref:Uncharacterized protein n=1 Tax=Labilithrix luteola TaxID=1391654 RepID=A0A0K1PY65_9BACT|nr:hypothetical protein AKJ09_04980 [Labilithrix luteola]
MNGIGATAGIRRNHGDLRAAESCGYTRFMQLHDVSNEELLAVLKAFVSSISARGASLQRGRGASPSHGGASRSTLARASRRNRLGTNLPLEPRAPARRSYRRHCRKFETSGTAAAATGANCIARRGS